jgi:hypothetical protein
MEGPRVPARYRPRTEDDPDGGRPLDNAAYLAKTVVGARPTLAVPILAVRRPGNAVRRDTDVVIEGYPKSANAFVSHAFRVAQPRQLRTAHTTHAVGQVIAGCRRGIPCLVLLRDPAEAVSRTALIRPKVSLGLLLEGWIHFYRPLLPWRRRFAVGRFREVTRDLGAVMVTMNEKLGTRFTPFDHTPENERAAFDALEADWATRIDPNTPEYDIHSGRPSARRDALTAAIERKLRGPRYAKLLREAEELHGAIDEA